MHRTPLALLFQYRELRTPGVYTVLKSYDVMRGTATTVAMIATKKCHDANRKVCAAFGAAMQAAETTLERDRRYGAEFLEDTGG